MFTPRYSPNKLSKDKENFESRKRKATCHIQESHQKAARGLSTDTLYGRREKDGSF